MISEHQERFIYISELFSWGCCLHKVNWWELMSVWKIRVRFRVNFILLCPLKCGSGEFCCNWNVNSVVVSDIRLVTMTVTSIKFLVTVIQLECHKTVEIKTIILKRRILCLIFSFYEIFRFIAKILEYV